MSTLNIINIVTQRSVSDKAQTPINVARFYPAQSTGGSTFGFGGTGTNDTNDNLEVATTSEVQYTRPKGVSFDGKHSGETKLTWMWKVEDVSLEDGLEDPCEFWVTIPPVEKGVKADFKVTCEVRGTGRDRRLSRRPTLVYTS